MEETMEEFVKSALWWLENNLCIQNVFMIQRILVVKVVPDPEWPGALMFSASPLGPIH